MLSLQPTLTSKEAVDALAQLRQALRASANDGQPVVLDGTALTRFDSSALAVVLECRREAEAAGRGFETRNLPERFTALAKLYGVLPLLGVARQA